MPSGDSATQCTWRAILRSYVRASSPPCALALRFERLSKGVKAQRERERDLSCLLVNILETKSANGVLELGR